MNDNNMSDAPFFSVLMLTYNSSWDKTRQTLYSVLVQKDVSFEIVIADDGSEENNFEKIRDYLASWNFAAYSLVANEQNQGIVRNFNSGLVLCKGEYIKPLSPGDFLYDENTLSACCEAIKGNDAAVYFGRAFFYSREADTVKIFADKANPRDLRPYLKKDARKIKRNYLFRCDQILGASVIYKKDIFQKYFSEIMPIVKYTEDLTIRFMIANNEKVEYLDISMETSCCQGLLWYEYASGISTSGDARWARLCYEDSKNVFRLLKEKRLVQRWLYDRYFLGNKIKRLFILLFYTPMEFAWKCIPRKYRLGLKGWNKKTCNIDKLKKILDV